MIRTLDEWHALGRKRILSILSKSRVTYNRHLEIKISEAGPRLQRVMPMLLSNVIREMVRSGELINQHQNPNILSLPDFGKPGDAARLKAFIGWHELFLKCSREEKLCGMVLERIVFEAVLLSQKYQIFGSGPEYDEKGNLDKPPHAELLHYTGKTIYGGEKGAGLDLFLVHQDLRFPIGIEVKNIREWVYPSSWQVWRLIARACSLECLPVLVARKIPYVTRAGLFKHFGILGFESQFQYYSQKIKAFSDYKFDDNVIHKDRLGFADIKFFKKGDDVPDYFVKFFRDNLHTNAPEYYERFMNYLPVLKKYAIDKGLAEEKCRNRSLIYQQFKEEVGYDDPSDEE
ncbi:hypothetical protein HQN89_33605 [Paenibacillus frigoriresistens]|uniref:hypothetical protein n=1 Tax=Paenibacillus alginolyticus TaxID=59839 RepID=UPI00156412C0|nr:hypothetical protein [Paenibacillus frigoriresistens]NRF95765.1 hypothetical protein [Paenibacillus frigoriresistens]